MVNIDKKGFAGNVLMNLVGNISISVVTQLIAFPYLTRHIGMNHFGTVLTLLGITNVVGVVFGGTINNIQLIKNQNYLSDGKKGDFKYLVICSTLISFVLTLGITYCLKNQLSLLEWLSVPIISCLVLLRSYMSVYYRLNLNYLFMMMHMLCAAIGYLIALPIFKLINFWPIIFIAGELFAFIFAIKTTDFLKDSLIKTDNFKSTTKNIIQLGLSNLISNLLLYLDRLVINPILGPGEVSVYYMATFVGKMIGVVFQPISGVTLSYLSIMPNKSGKQIYITSSIVCIVLGLFILFTSIPLSSLIIHILYPDSENKASKYFLIANLGSVFGIMGSLFQPIVLRFCPIYWQVFIQIIYLLVYLVTGLILISFQGIFGFCIAVIIANFVRLVALLFVGYLFIIKPNITLRESNINSF